MPSLSLLCIRVLKHTACREHLAACIARLEKSTSDLGGQPCESLNFVALQLRLNNGAERLSDTHFQAGDAAGTPYAAGEQLREENVSLK